MPEQSLDAIGLPISRCKRVVKDLGADRPVRGNWKLDAVELSIAPNCRDQNFTMSYKITRLYYFVDGPEITQVLRPHAGSSRRLDGLRGTCVQEWKCE
jgi:hypothetical protein